VNITLVGGSHSEKLLYAMGAEFVEVRINALTKEIRVPHCRRLRRRPHHEHPHRA
jgi:CO/xanthine dehydrogenase Mo-binding subunit